MYKGLSNYTYQQTILEYLWKTVADSFTGTNREPSSGRHTLYDITYKYNKPRLIYKTHCMPLLL